jgi:beta-glucosidase
VLRILVQKFEQGLFEAPYVDVDRAASIVGNPQFLSEALLAQCRSFVLLENKNKILPLTPGAGRKVFLYHIDPKVAGQAGFTVVDDIKNADLAIARVTTPFEKLHPNFFFGSRHTEGDLSYKDGNPDYEAVKTFSSRVPTIVTVYLDRPAILTNIKDKAAAILGNFGASDDALFQVLTGKRVPEGKLPFELPSSMEEIAKQRSDLPHDTRHPLYRFGYGLRYDLKNG